MDNEEMEQASAAMRRRWSQYAHYDQVQASEQNFTLWSGRLEHPDAPANVVRFYVFYDPFKRAYWVDAVYPRNGRPCSGGPFAQDKVAKIDALLHLLAHIAMEEDSDAPTDPGARPMLDA